MGRIIHATILPLTMLMRSMAFRSFANEGEALCIPPVGFFKGFFRKTFHFQ